MAWTADAMREELLSLPLQERARIASDLLASLDSEAVDEAEIDELWSVETQRRAATLEAGEARTLTWDDIEERFARRRGATQRVSLRIEYHERVDVDVLTAWTWYEDREHGLGDRLLDAISATVERAAQLPNVGTPVLRDDTGEIIERKIAANGFPYAVRYRILGDRLVVMAVLHQRRHPNFGDDRRP